MTDKQAAKRRLKPFRQVIAEHRRNEDARQVIARVLSEEAEGMTITAATTVIIDSEDQPSDRAEAINGFVADIRNMSGAKIIGVAVACT